VNFSTRAPTSPIADNDGLAPLNSAAINGHVEVVKLFLGVSSVNASEADPLGRTALFLASRFGQHEVVQVLLADGRIDAGNKDWCGSTALFAAVANGYLDSVKLLAAGGTAVDNNCRFGRSLIWWARRAGNIGIIELLVQRAKPVGSPIYDDTIPIDAASVPFDPKSGWCDACTLGVQNGCGYSCRECTWFGLCGDCFDGGIRCRDASHILCPRY